MLPESSNPRATFDVTPRTMTDVNHGDTETQRNAQRMVWVGWDEPRRLGASPANQIALCVLCVSVSLWLTSVIK